jgi:hypothetical protein
MNRKTRFISNFIVAASLALSYCSFSMASQDTVEDIKTFATKVFYLSTPFIVSDYVHGYIKKHHHKSIFNTKITKNLILASLAVFCWPHVLITKR